MTTRSLLFPLVLFGALGASAPGQSPQTIRMTEALVLDPVSAAGRTWLRTDYLEADLAHRGAIPFTPAEGDAVTDSPETTKQWVARKVTDSGWFVTNALRGGYLCWVFDSPSARVMMLDASGHSGVWVNGVPRTGDPYENGWTVLPVFVRRGENSLVFRGSRGRVRAALVEAPASGVAIQTAEPTMGDVLLTEPDAVWRCAVVVANASLQPLKGLRARAAGDDASALEVPEIPPLGVRKVMFAARGLAGGEPGERDALLEVIRPGRGGAGDEVLASATVKYRVLSGEPGQVVRRTFVSGIDGSLQYYALREATGNRPDAGLVLTLHGASVEATNQVSAYQPKPDFHIVAPTNRRPFGFDWEDWGRVDAMEVLALAERLPHDPARVYLTGHSMGGHGVWQIGGLYPDRFAAIAPSAGWPTFWTYTERSGVAPWDTHAPDSIVGLAHRAARTSDTLALIDNYHALGVYILHGDADDNVPVAQARMMRDRLRNASHADLHYHEQEGAGHWWGDQCVDWPPIFELFRSCTIPGARDVERVRFATADPLVSADCFWLRVEAQQRRLVPTTTDVRLARAGGPTFSGTTDNAAAVSFDARALGLSGGITVELDGTKLGPLSPGADGRVRLVRRGGEWADASGGAPPAPVPGPFKRVFDRNFVLVYGTRGSEEEQNWALAKARLDAETWWYRGNGACDVLADVDFDPDAPANRGRNVILYGNADTNALYDRLLGGDAPVRVERGRVSVDGRRLREDLLGVMFVWTRRDAGGPDAPLVGVVGGTGPVGMRALDRTPVFVSGVGIPDVLVIGQDMLVRGAPGVRAMGFYGPDGRLSSGSLFIQQGFDDAPWE